MSIDFSVLIWTIICFVILMLLLNRFLFKPLLAVMDKRKKTISEGLEAGRRAEEEIRGKQEQLARQLEESRRQESERAKREAQSVDAALENALNEGDLDQRVRRDEAADAAQRDRAALTETLTARVPEYAALLAEKLIAGLPDAGRTP